MEKYQMFFPPSSSSSPDMTSSLAACTQPFHNFQDHDPMFHSSSSSNCSGRGFLHHDFVNNSAIDEHKNNNVVFEEINDDKEVVSKKDGKKKIKKPKFAFQTRSQVDILDDGYRWRKYGQKAVKNNKFPRSYYRCTQSGCSVKKQVQRVADDEGVVVTTYEGMHTHPIHNPTDNFEHILTQMQVYAPF